MPRSHYFDLLLYTALIAVRSLGSIECTVCLKIIPEDQCYSLRLREDRLVGTLFIGSPVAKLYFQSLWCGMPA